MTGVANRPAETLGLLDRKRLELARALATRPTLLLLDEIGGGLTDAEAQELVATILELKRRGIAIVWIEHIVHILLQVAGRLICMDAGKIIADGEPQRRDGRSACHQGLSRRGPEMSVLAVEKLDVRHGLLQAVRDVSFSVERGETLALVGANGAGKTTLLRAIAGAHLPAGGRILLGDDDITQVPSHRRVGMGVALVPEGRRLFAQMTVEENLLLGRTSRPARRVERRAGAGDVPQPQAAPPCQGWPSVGRRAAGDGDRPRADDQSGDAAARRGVARPVAAGRRPRLRLAAGADRRRHDDRPGRAGSVARHGCRRPRAVHAGRPHRAGTRQGRCLARGDHPGLFRAAQAPRTPRRVRP